jgi:hypothetical protein
MRNRGLNQKHGGANVNIGGQEMLSLAKVEKVFVTSSMVQNSRNCMTLAWNPINPRLFAAGYDHTSMNDSSLMIWDIEQGMNQYLNKVRFDDQQQPYLRVNDPFGVQ